MLDDSNKNYKNAAKVLNHYKIEKIVIITLAALYLFLFKTIVPNGDALYYASNVASGSVIFNPNHMLMDPIGLLASKFFLNLGFLLETMDIFKIISGLSAIISLCIFHSILVELKVKSILIRYCSVILLFSSRNFLSMGITEEYYMVQMPFIMLATLFSIKWIQNKSHNNEYFIYIIGLCLGVATAIALNNIFVLFFIGIYLGFNSDLKFYRLSTTFATWVSAGTILIPLYIAAYLYSSSDLDFLQWFTSYQGKSENPTEVLYGLEFTIKGILISLSKLIYNLPINFIDVGGLGTILKSAVFSITLEYKPNFTKIIVSMLMLLLFIILLALFIHWSFKLFRQFKLVQFSLIWIFSYLVFNFYWNDSSDQFWFQILPIIWIMFLIMSGVTSYSETKLPQAIFKEKTTNIFIPVLTCILLTINSINVMYPLTFETVDDKRNEIKMLIQENDMEIFTGWDNMQWMKPDESFPEYKRLMLMELVLGTNKDNFKIEHLPELIKAHLEKGHRVIISRLYSKDHEVRPWDNLRKAGWPRKRIIELLGIFKHEEITQIDGVSFHQIRLTNDP